MDTGNRKRKRADLQQDQMPDPQQDQASKIEIKKQKMLARPAIADSRLFKATEGGTPNLSRAIGGASLDPKKIKFLSPKQTTRLFSSLQKNYFVKKDPDASLVAFLEELMRSISAKRVVMKRTVVYNGEEFGQELLIKWDPNFLHLSGDFSLKAQPLQRLFYKEDILRALQKQGITDAVEQEEIVKKFTADYAYLCGLKSGFGEADPNPCNIGFSLKNYRPIAIDNHPLINHLTSGDQPNYGSGFTNDFLCAFLGQEQRELLPALDSRRYNHLLLEIKKLYLEEEGVNAQEYNKLFLDCYKRGIDAVLYYKIKQNIEKDPELGIYFKAFIEGLKNFIALSQDELFLDSLKEKYQNLIAKEYFDRVFGVLEENAQKTEEQFRLFFILCDLLDNKETYLSEDEEIAILEKDLAMNSALLDDSLKNLEDYKAIKKEYEKFLLKDFSKTIEAGEESANFGRTIEVGGELAEAAQDFSDLEAEFKMDISEDGAEAAQDPDQKFREIKALIERKRSNNFFETEIKPKDQPAEKMQSPQDYFESMCVYFGERVAILKSVLAQKMQPKQGSAIDPATASATESMASDTKAAANSPKPSSNPLPLQSQDQQQSPT